jgi:hypothetical protein
VQNGKFSLKFNELFELFELFEFFGDWGGFNGVLWGEILIAGLFWGEF